jgi:hypothetical protein
LERHSAELACKVLAGHPAAWAGPALRATERRFAAVVTHDSNGQPGVDPKPLVDVLAACGQAVKVVEIEPGSTTASANAMLSLRNEGYTTVFVLVEGGEFVDPGSGNVLTAARQVGYAPEWFLPGLYAQDDAGYLGAFAGEQARQMLGLSARNKILPSSVEPAGRAFAEHHVQYDGGWPQHDLYEELMLLATGIQTAGPRLTPATFRQGLEATEFPNPGAASRPSYQATVGFGNAHEMIQDVGLWWWQPEGRNPNSPKAGFFCYVGRGARFSLGSWPTTDPGLFDAAKGC